MLPFMMDIHTTSKGININICSMFVHVLKSMGADTQIK